MQVLKEDRVHSVLVTMQSLDQENPPYASVARESAGDGSISVLRMRDLAEAYEMGLGGSLVVGRFCCGVCELVEGIPLCPGIHRRLVGPTRAFRRDLR